MTNKINPIHYVPACSMVINDTAISKPYITLYNDLLTLGVAGLLFFFSEDLLLNFEKTHQIFRV